MKKALIEMTLQYHTAEDFAKALHIMDFASKNDVPLGDVERLYCQAVFTDVIDLLEFFIDVCDGVGFDS